MWEALARFGDDAVEPIIRVYRSSSDDLKRENAIITLSLIKERAVSQSSRNKIRQIFLEASKDDSVYVRNAAQKAMKDQ